jgi:hypothetical protein
MVSWYSKARSGVPMPLVSFSDFSILCALSNIAHPRHRRCLEQFGNTLKLAVELYLEPLDGVHCVI